MPRELEGWLRPRPSRVAFLVEEGEHADFVLDGVFADCYNRWGGRFSLVVPCLNGRIAPSYWAWLEAYDPDIVYSYLTLNERDVLEIHERLTPATYISHKLGREPRYDVFDFKPSYDFSPLSSLSTIFKLARHSAPPTAGAPVKIIDSWHTESPSRFLTDNFGTYHTSRGGGIYPPDATPAASLLTIVSPEKKDGRYGVPRDLDTVPNEIAAFKEFADRRATSLSIASILFASKLDIRDHRWSGSFNLVVGGSFIDRVIFWNARLLIPAWLDNDLCCFRVELDQLKQPEFLSVLGDLLKRRNFVNSGTGGQSQLTIRSGSLSADQLNEVRELVLSTKPWSALGIQSVAGVDSVVPTEQSLQAAKESNRFGTSLPPRSDWIHFTWSQPAAKPPIVVPDHLADAPVRQLFTDGYWSTDFSFEYDGPGPSFAEKNRWILPRRWRLAGAFKTSLVGGDFLYSPPPSRRSRDGNLAIFVSASHSIETIEVPTAIDAMRHALVVDGMRADQVDSIYPTSKVAWAEPSNEARYLTGILGMTGGLHRAGQFLLHPFLRQMFAELGGTPQIPPDKITPTINRLKKRARSDAAFDVGRDDERQALAELIVKAARTLKTPMQFVRYEDLKTSWRAHRAQYWAELGVQNQDVDWDLKKNLLMSA